MIDPTDRDLAVFREGDADITPGAPNAGPFGEIPESDIHAPEACPPDMFEQRTYTIAAGAVETWDVGDRPAYWIISLDPTAATSVRAHPYEVASGYGTLVSLNRALTIPALSRFLTLVGVGATPAVVSVMAVRNHLAVVGFS